jgi:predicted peroxiredoxin
LKVLVEGEAEKIKVGSFPTVKEVLAQTAAQGRPDWQQYNQ